MSFIKLNASIPMLSLLKRSISITSRSMHTDKYQKIGFIGTGNMARAIIQGLVTKKQFLPEQIYATDKNIEYLQHLKTNEPFFQVIHKI